MSIYDRTSFDYVLGVESCSVIIKILLCLMIMLIMSANLELSTAI